MTLEELLSAITAAGWYTRLVEVNGGGGLDRQWHSESGTFRDADGAVASRVWWADLHHGLAIKKHGYGPSAHAALIAAWNSEEVERESLYLRHPEPAPPTSLEDLGLVKSRPILRRI